VALSGFSLGGALFVGFYEAYGGTILLVCFYAEVVRGDSGARRERRAVVESGAETAWLVV
jgi:hypothetical protein